MKHNKHKAQNKKAVLYYSVGSGASLFSEDNVISNTTYQASNKMGTWWLVFLHS
jgi:hypothetical protein